MRKTLTSLVALAGALALAACGEPATQTSPAPSPNAETPSTPATVAPQETAANAAVEADASASCETTLGPVAAAALVKRCIAVSPATRPPCNVANPCALVQGEIDRSCAMYGPDEPKPAECSA